MVLRPINEKSAPDSVQAVFEDAKKILDTGTVPVMLRFIANAEPYLNFLWESMRQDVSDPAFQEISQKLTSFSKASLTIIYTPSPRATEFTRRLQGGQKRELAFLIEKLFFLNSMFFLFALDLREDLKTAFTQAEKKRTIKDGQGLFAETNASGDSQRTDVETTASRMLAPLFGTAFPVLPKVETFFSVTEGEFEKLAKTEAYLKTRVELERIGLMYIHSIPYRMNSNYKVFMGLIENTYIAYDLLYLLTHVFPSEFPRLLLISALMNQILIDKTDIMQA